MSINIFRPPGGHVHLLRRVRVIQTIFFILFCLAGTTSANSSDLNNTSTITLINTSDSQDNIRDSPPQYLISTPDSTTPVIRYTNESLPASIRTYIDHIDFQNTTQEKGQVFIYFTLPARDASVNRSYDLADAIISKTEWVGDRSRDSVAAEVYIHWIAENAKPLFMTTSRNKALYEKEVIGISDERPSPIHPTHLGYFYAGLGDTDPMEQFLKNI